MLALQSLLFWAAESLTLKLLLAPVVPLWIILRFLVGFVGSH